MASSENFFPTVDAHLTINNIKIMITNILYDTLAIRNITSLELNHHYLDLTALFRPLTSP